MQKIGHGVKKVNNIMEKKELPCIHYERTFVDTIEVRGGAVMPEK